MSSWGFGRESTQVVAGANTVAGIKKGFQPFNIQIFEIGCVLFFKRDKP